MSGVTLTPFRKILIANRGEIAVRVMRTLREMGIASLAIHHRVEANAAHVRLADEAREVHGETPVAAHLDAEQIIAIAKAFGADAVHPGYGFLSENARFAELSEPQQRRGRWPLRLPRALRAGGTVPVVIGLSGRGRGCRGPRGRA